jgi:hypothetical protein
VHAIVCWPFKESGKTIARVKTVKIFNKLLLLQIELLRFIANKTPAIPAGVLKHLLWEI